MVVKPLSASLRSQIRQQKLANIGTNDQLQEDADFLDPEASFDSIVTSSYQHRRTNENDDYAFLDEDILNTEEDEDVRESLQRRYKENLQTPSNIGLPPKSQVQLTICVSIPFYNKILLSFD